jgi:ribokinase
VPGDNFLEHIPIRHTRSIVNTIGAGDALFTAFIHYYIKQNDPYVAIQKAMVYASYKIGANGAANGLLDEASLEELMNGTSILLQ